MSGVNSKIASYLHVSMPRGHPPSVERRVWPVGFDPNQYPKSIDVQICSPFALRGLTVALGSSELAGIAETRRARVA